MATTTATTTTTCLLYSLAEEEEEEVEQHDQITDIPTPRPSLDKGEDTKEQQSVQQPQKEAVINFVLPPTPSTSDDEQEEEKQAPKRLSRRDSVSLADLIPIASAALRAKHRLSLQQQHHNNPPSTQESPLARALTKVKIGVTTHRIKIKYLTNEWIRLALAVPVDETTINSNIRILKTKRTKEIVKWYEYKFKRTQLSLEELEQKVDELRRQKLLYTAIVVEDTTSPFSSPAIASKRLSLLVK